MVIFDLIYGVGANLFEGYQKSEYAGDRKHIIILIIACGVIISRIVVGDLTNGFRRKG